jgi:hypothetical protein
MSSLASPSPHSPAAPIGVEALLLALAAAVLGYALQLTHGHYDPDGIWLAVAAWVLSLCALVVRVQVKTSWLELVLGGAVVAQLYFLSVSPPTVEMPGVRQAKDLLNFFAGLFVIAGLVASGATGDARVKRWWFPAVVATHFVMGLLILKLAPSPNIDVFVVENEGLKALFHGENPFAITMPNPYGDASPFYPPGTSVGGRLQFGFVYPPLALLLCAPGWLLGDVRYSTLAAMSLAALLIGYTRNSTVSKLAAVLFLMTPRTFFVADRAWTDPFIVMLTALVAWAALHQRRWLFVAMGLFAALKQSMFIGGPALLLLFPWPLKPREVLPVALRALGVGMALTLPFVAWNPHAFVNSVIDIREVYRTDCLSLVAHLANTHVAELSRWSGLLAIIPVVALGLWRAPRTPFGFAALIAATHCTLYIWSTHAFCNEYYNVLGALCLALALWAPAQAPEAAGAKA